MHVFSFMGIFCAIHISLYLFYKLRFVSLPFQIFVSLVCAILLDAAIMLPWEIYTFPLSKFWGIFFRSLFYKSSLATRHFLKANILSVFQKSEKGIDGIRDRVGNQKLKGDKALFKDRIEGTA